MTLRLPVAVFVSITALCSATSAADRPLRTDWRLNGLESAQFDPGKLKLPLTVHERSGLERRGVVVTSGVPFPPGFLADVKKLGVLDKDGRPVPSQATVTVKWHKPVYDDSAQWVLVSFLCDVPANGTATYCLTDDGKAAAPVTQLTCNRAETRAEDLYTIETGVASFDVWRSSQAPSALIRRAAINGLRVIDDLGVASVITSGDWTDRALTKGRKHFAQVESLTVEESGPVRIVFALKGRYTPGDKDGKFYGFTTRLYFEAGSPSVRIIHTIENSRIESKLIDDWRRLYTWPIWDASLVVGTKLDGDVTATTIAEDKAVSAKTLTVYQDSSGGDKWQNLGGGNYEGWISAYTKGQTVRGTAFRGYKVTDAGKEVAAGNAHLGVMDVSNGKAGVAVALRNFHLEHPHALVGGRLGLRIGLFPGEFSEPFHLNPGQRKSWDIRLTLHGEKAPDLRQLYAEHDALLLFRVDPAWFVRCSATGTWPYGALSLAANPRAKTTLRRDTSKLDGIHTGWDWYGWISGWNSGGGHWNEETCFAPWVLWGDGANFDYAEACALWAADLTAINFDKPDIPALWLWLMSWNDHEPRVKKEFYPAWYNRDTWGLPDSGHMGMLMWPEYYYLTGDARAREAIEHLGNRARAMLWPHNYDDRADGTGPMRGAVNWCKKRDPDADPDFKLATRYTGWPLFDLANWYRICGDPQILAECKTVARAFRNTARYSPIGFMVLQINPKGSKDVYGGQGPFEKYRDLSASQCYAHFQEGLMATGLIEYYLMSRDAEALDPLIGLSDLMCHHAMLRDTEGKRRGWTYAFGDYWGPYTWDDCGGKGATFLVSNYTVTTALGWAYRFTGRADVLDVLKDAAAEVRGLAFNVTAAHNAVAHPNVDEVPPAAIMDLKAEALGAGKVRLTWTAPGGDGATGQAAWYQVKLSAAKIVERVSGWPDRSEPLPADAKDWEARAAAFNAKQRAFWAANTVGNPGDYRPQPVGARENVEVTGLAPGSRYFAVKSWDAADNVSGLSNVVSVEVK